MELSHTMLSRGCFLSVAVTLTTHMSLWAAVTGIPTPPEYSEIPSQNSSSDSHNELEPERKNPSREIPGLANGQFNDGNCPCEDDIGDSCISNFEEPCCFPLSCQYGRCIDRFNCISPGAICPAGPRNCCFFDGQACFVDLQLGQYTCQNCVDRRSACNPLVPDGFPGGCCPNSLCQNRGFGFFCYPITNSFGLVPE